MTRSCRLQSGRGGAHGCGVVGVPVIDRHPFHPGTEVALRVGHQFPSEGAKVGHLTRALGRHGEPEVMSILLAPRVSASSEVSSNIRASAPSRLMRSRLRERRAWRAAPNENGRQRDARSWSCQRRGGRAIGSPGVSAARRPRPKVEWPLVPLFGGDVWPLWSAFLRGPHRLATKLFGRLAPWTP